MVSEQPAAAANCCCERPSASLSPLMSALASTLTVTEVDSDLRVGHNELGYGRLCLMTGLLDDSRTPVSPGHRLYERARHAFDRRDEWEPWEHGAFFTALLPEWPGSGPKPTRDALSLALALLVCDGLNWREAADAIGVSHDTVRFRDRSPQRERPSVDRGNDILQRQAEESRGVLLRRMAGRLWDPFNALPRVLSEHEDGPEPDDAFFNPLVELLDGERLGSEAGEQYLARAQAKRRELWCRSHSGLPAGS